MPKNCEPAAPRQFDFARDTFAFDNETFWGYHFDRAAGKTTFSKRVPPPTYAHRCFVLTRAARQFLYHVRFDPALKPGDDAACRRWIRQTAGRNPRTPCPPEAQVIIPGYANLREFSAARGQLLKDECGGAWRSYVLRSHWRMVFPISRKHQAATAASIFAALHQTGPAIVHIVKFPALTINHSLLIFGAQKSVDGIQFAAYDPNVSSAPTTLSYDHKARTFSLPSNHYWAGGALDVIEIYRSWWM
jgi:hypothetical protein